MEYLTIPSTTVQTTANSVVETAGPTVLPLRPDSCNAAVPACGSSAEQELDVGQLPDVACVPGPINGNTEKPLVDTTHGDLSNTRGLNSHNPRFIGLLHYLSLAYYVSWKRWNTLRKDLSEGRNRTRYQGTQTISFGGHTAKLYARSPGMGKGRLRMPYYLVIDGIQFLLGDRRSASGSAPNLIVLVTGQHCLRWTIKELLSFIRSVIKSAGGTIAVERLSRVDVALDLLDIPIDEFWLAYQEKRYVARPKSHRMIDSTDGRSLYFGKVPTSMIIYDKLAEQRSKATERIWDEANYMYKLWGRSGTAVTRVEYRLFY